MILVCLLLKEDADGTHILCGGPLSLIEILEEGPPSFSARGSVFCWLYKSHTVVIERVLLDQ